MSFNSTTGLIFIYIYIYNLKKKKKTSFNNKVHLHELGPDHT